MDVYTTVTNGEAGPKLLLIELQARAANYPIGGGLKVSFLVS